MSSKQLWQFVQLGDLEGLKSVLSIRQLKAVGEKESFAFITAAQNDHLAIVEYFVENGVDIDYKNKNGETALMGASMYDNPQIVEYLIKKGASLNERSHTSGKTALMFASEKGNCSVVRHLLENRAAIDALNIQQPLL